MPLRRYGPGLYGWGRHQPRWHFDFNGHALVCDGDDEGCVLVVDPIEPTDAELEAVRALGDRFVVVVLNADHERDAARVADALDAPVFVPRADEGAVTVEGAQVFDPGQVLPGGWRAIGLTDLKTPGETVLYHPARRVLVCGDALVGDPVSGLRFVPPVKIPDRAKALASVASLRELDFDALLLSDGVCIPQGGWAVVNAFLENNGL